MTEDTIAKICFYILAALVALFLVVTDFGRGFVLFCVMAIFLCFALRGCFLVVGVQP